MRGRAARAAGLGLLAAVAVLLALGGPARGGGDASGTRTVAATTVAQAPPGRALFLRMGCGSCHRLAAGAGIGQVGPDLDAKLPDYDARSLRAKIVDPYPNGLTTFIAMPDDFGRRMNARELDELVAFLLDTVRR